jgi:DNA-binding response OmpR family regulator
MAQVLCTGVDVSLLRTRKMLLEQAGHSVTTVTREDELREACETAKFDVVVIGQSVSPRQKHRVADLVRNHCPEVLVVR